MKKSKYRKLSNQELTDRLIALEEKENDNHLKMLMSMFNNSNCGFAGYPTDNKENKGGK